MDFFERQDQARRRTTKLLLFFALGLVTLIGLVYLLTAFLFLYLQKPPNQPPRMWDARLLAAVVGGVLIVVMGGSLLKAAQLASGGKSVALMMNGREVLGNTTDLKERRLLNVVEEMAIASGVAVPPVFLLPEEGINAFAAGHSAEDAVVAVSQGCLKYLTRDELQGVVGHEFSHILNGDVRLNLRIMALIFGIMALSQIGWVILQTTPSRDSSGKDNGGGIQLLGLGLYLLGMGGAFFGWLIQAAVSRQREFLADASAVQFTRNPDGIGGALKKIGGLQISSRLSNSSAGEMSHMFFADAFSGKRLSDLLATHPPLDERIRCLDPRFDGTYPDVKPVGVSPEEAKGPQRGRIPPLIPGLPGGPLTQFPAIALAAGDNSATLHVGRVQPHHVDYAAALQSHDGDILREATQDAFSARALVYCLLLDARQPIREAQLAQLRSGCQPRDFTETLRLAEAVRQLDAGSRLPLVERALPALRQMSPQQHQEFRTQVDALIHADQQVSLFEYALHCVLTRYLDLDFNKQNAQARFRQPMQVAPQVAAVLSLVAWEGQSEPVTAQAAFSAAMKTYVGSDQPAFRLLPRDQCDLRTFHAALQTLAQAVPDIQRRVVASCAQCILADGQVTVTEGELLRAICASLGCPMPPLVSAKG